jgi:hypothetical protein
MGQLTDEEYSEIKKYLELEGFLDSNSNNATRTTTNIKADS